MGCWNHTCAITNLPIIVGEEVEVILLRSPSFDDGGSYCYPNTSWTPIPLTFSGIYNDYGAVENCHGPALDIIIDTLRENLHEMEVGENKYHDIEAKKEDFDVDYMFNLDHEGRFFIQNPARVFPDSSPTCRVKHIVVRKDVYEGIVTKTKFSRWMSKESLTFEKIDTNEFTKDLDDILTPINDVSLEDLKDIEEMGEEQWAILRKSLKRYSIFDGVGKSEVNDIICHKGQGTSGVNRPIYPIEILMKLREEESDLYTGVLDNALRFGFFDLFMNSARKTYTVPSGMGSQDDATDTQELCARLTLSSAKAQRKWRKDRYEE